MFVSLIIFSSIFFIIIENDKILKQNYARFLGDINIPEVYKIIKNTIKNNNLQNEVSSKELKALLKDTRPAAYQPRDRLFLRNSHYNRVFRTAVEIWKERPLTGFGLKSMRIKCWMF